MSTQPEDESSRQPASQGTLFNLPKPPATDEPAAAGYGKPRLRTANRRQVEWQPFALDELLPAEHQARVVWDYVQDLDLAPLLDQIAAVEGRPGHPPIDPHILLALWLYATLRGVGSARELDRRPVPVSEVVPELSSLRQINGTFDIVLDYIVAANGSVQHVRELAGVPGEIALLWIQAARGWHYSPGIKDGQPVATELQRRLRISLSHSSTSDSLQGGLFER